jgi:hypothetical protein
VERVDGGAIARGERDVHGSRDGRSFLDPEVSAPVGGEAQRPLLCTTRTSKGFNAST